MNSPICKRCKHRFNCITNNHFIKMCILDQAILAMELEAKEKGVRTYGKAIQEKRSARSKGKQRSKSESEPQL
jgi:hypothetical protein